MTTVGIDEVGMGCIAGPVYAAAVILHADHGIVGLRDSKTLTPRQLIRYDAEIRTTADVGVGTASVEEIDELGIVGASWSAMNRALAALEVTPTLCLVDGAMTPKGLDVDTVQAVPHGDRTEETIMAAAIVAKVARDAEMTRLDSIHPGYGFAANKGYPTRDGLAALNELGICEVHRRSFGPVNRQVRRRQPTSEAAGLVNSSGRMLFR